MVSPVSFGALRTFVEVGRQGGIKAAAQELNVTPGAVSQQIKALEARFGVPLIERGNRSVKLTPDGLRLFGRIAPGFEEIDAAVRMFEDRKPGPTTLVVSTTPSFAACWLVPRLGRFAALHPDIEIRLETTARLADFGRERVDVAIRHGKGSYPGLHSDLLLTPSLIAIGSPDLLGGPLSSAADCLRFPLLQDRDRADWHSWLEANSVSPGDIAAKGPSYADDGLLIQAAAAGQGLAIVRDVYAANALAEGTIIRAGGAPVPAPDAYHAVTRPGQRGSRKLTAFLDWLHTETHAPATD